MLRRAARRRRPIDERERRSRPATRARWRARSCGSTRATRRSRPARPGESACVTLLRDVLDAWGFRIEVHDAAPGRPNLLARIGARARRTDADVQRPSRRRRRGGHDARAVRRRGARRPALRPRRGGHEGRHRRDVRGRVAAARDVLAGEIIVAATADEEYESVGTRAMLERGVRADAAIVGEPTRLEIMPAHRGFVWIEVVVAGRAAHGSRWDLGVDAIRHAGSAARRARSRRRRGAAARDASAARPRVAARVDDRGRHRHVHVSRPLRAAARAAHAARRDGPRTPWRRSSARAPPCVRDGRSFAAERARCSWRRDRATCATDAPVVRALERRAAGARGRRARDRGMSAWTDAALLNAAGIPAICFGPGDISLAHAAEEYIPLPRSTARPRSSRRSLGAGAPELVPARRLACPVARTGHPTDHRAVRRARARDRRRPAPVRVAARHRVRRDRGSAAPRRADARRSRRIIPPRATSSRSTSTSSKGSRSSDERRDRCRAHELPLVAIYADESCLGQRPRGRTTRAGRRG